MLMRSLMQLCYFHKPYALLSNMLDRARTFHHHLQIALLVNSLVILYMLLESPGITLVHFASSYHQLSGSTCAPMNGPAAPWYG